VKKSKEIDVKSQLFTHIQKSIPEYADADSVELQQMLFMNTNTIRLHIRGFNFMKKYFECYDFAIDNRLSGADLLTLKRQVQFPYFLSAKRLYVFSSKDAFVLKLNGGNVKKWLSSKKS
jgi:hypothetical protein